MKCTKTFPLQVSLTLKYNDYDAPSGPSMHPRLRSKGAHQGHVGDQQVTRQNVIAIHVETNNLPSSLTQPLIEGD